MILIIIIEKREYTMNECYDKKWYNYQNFYNVAVIYKKSKRSKEYHYMGNK